VTRVLTPELTLAYVRELSCGVAAAELRAPSGERLAGDGVDVERALRVRAEGAELLLEVGPYAVQPLVRHDAEAALAALNRPPEAS
jgi:hypothetical protein